MNVCRPCLRWQGPECQMCHGTGVARMIPGDGKPYFVHCPACNGHGREATEHDAGDTS
jgi:DnaJ-class molecular chaperone